MNIFTLLIIKANILTLKRDYESILHYKSFEKKHVLMKINFNFY